MKAVCRYIIPELPEGPEVTISMPIDGKVRRVTNLLSQGTKMGIDPRTKEMGPMPIIIEQIGLWVEGTIGLESMNRTFKVFDSDQGFDDNGLEYCGSVPINQGTRIVHIYEAKNTSLPA